MEASSFITSKSAKSHSGIGFQCLLVNSGCLFDTLSPNVFECFLVIRYVVCEESIQQEARETSGHFDTLRTARAESESDFQMSLAFLPN